jgi:hypothetical protein
MIRTIGLFVASAAMAACVSLPAPASAATSCGGSGGVRTQTFVCGSGELVTGLVAQGDAFLHQLSVQCSRIEGQKIGVHSVLGKQSGKMGVKGAGAQTGKALALCPEGMAVWSVDSYCGLFVDRLVSINCSRIDGSGGGRVFTHSNDLRFLNVGGDGGRRVGLTCGAGKWISQVTVRSDERIDRIQIACREP